MEKSLSRKVSKNVFQIIPLNPFAANMTVERARQRYQSVCAGNLESLSQSEVMNCEVFRSCKSKETCLAEYAPHGTAFAIDGGDKLMTAWHVTFGSHSTPLFFLFKAFENYSKIERNEILKSTLEPAFILLNQDKEIVFDTRKEKKSSSKYLRWGDPLSTAHSEFGSKQDRPYGYFENIPDDYVVIELPHSIAGGLEYRNSQKASLNKNECYYSAGFSYNSKIEEYRIVGGLPSSLKKLKGKLKQFSPFMLNPLAIQIEEFQALELREKMSFMGYEEEKH